MRKQIYEQELQKEQEAKQRVKDDLMEALVRIYFFSIISIFFFSFIQVEMLIKYLKKVLKTLKKNVKKKFNQSCLIWYIKI